METSSRKHRSGNIVGAILTHDATLLVLRIILGTLFIYASYDKVLNPQQFAIAVRAYKIIPVELSNLFAIMLSWSELIAGILIIVGVMTRQAASAIFIMLAMFIIAILVSIIRGLAIDCGCFRSEGGHTVDFTLLIRDIFLLVAAYIVVRFDQGSLALSRLFSNSRS